MTGTLAGLAAAMAAGVALTLLAQFVAHRVQVYRLNRKWARWRQGNGHLSVTWPAPEPAAPPGSLIVAPPMGRADVAVLGRYNAEVARGVQHTPEWQERMAELQRRFNDASNRESSAELALSRSGEDTAGGRDHRSIMEGDK